MKADIEQFKKSMKLAKEKEINFYKKLNLSATAKNEIFQIDLKESSDKKVEKIIVWDPV